MCTACSRCVSKGGHGGLRIVRMKLQPSSFLAILHGRLLLHLLKTQTREKLIPPHLLLQVKPPGVRVEIVGGLPAEVWE